MTSTMTESVLLWEQACDDVAEEVLTECGVLAPPVDALELAARMDLPVAFDEIQPGRGRLKRLAGRPAIFVQPEERHERLQWSVAHEIGEACAHRVFTRIGCDPEDVSAGQREQVANVMASRLLQWRIIRDLASDGIERYDLGHVPPPGEPDAPGQGILVFKSAFTREVLEYMPAFQLSHEERGEAWRQGEGEFLAAYRERTGDYWY